MTVYDDVITGREALHRLDTLVVNARAEFDAAAQAAEGHARRRAELTRLRAEGYRQLAKIRLDLISAGTDQSLDVAEREAGRLLDEHAAFVARLGEDVLRAEQGLQEAEAQRRTAEAAIDAALHAYETLTAKVENDVEADPAYVNLRQGFEKTKAVVLRAEQKLELARADRAEKRKPYEDDPLFAYLWERGFRTKAYQKKGLTRVLDGWVARLCRYDSACPNYLRLTELPERIAEHLATMKLEAAEAQAAMERFEVQRLEEAGAAKLAAELIEARKRLKSLDEDLAVAEARHSSLRQQQTLATSGEAGPYEKARRVVEQGLAKVSFPDLKVLAAETTTPDDDRIVDALIRLRTEELQLEVNWRNVEALPERRRAGADALERVRRRFRDSGLDNPYVMVLRGAFEAALEAYGGGSTPDEDSLWRAVNSTIRQLPRSDDDYFGGRRRARDIGVGEVVAGVIIGEVIKAATRGSGWGGGWPGSGRSGGGPGTGGRFGGGGFKTGGRFGGGGFKTGGRF